MDDTGGSEKPPAGLRISIVLANKFRDIIYIRSSVSPANIRLFVCLSFPLDRKNVVQKGKDASPPPQKTKACNFYESKKNCGAINCAPLWAPTDRVAPPHPLDLSR